MIHIFHQAHPQIYPLGFFQLKLIQNNTQSYSRTCLIPHNCLRDGISEKIVRTNFIFFFHHAARNFTGV